MTSSGVVPKSVYPTFVQVPQRVDLNLFTEPSMVTVVGPPGMSFLMMDSSAFSLAQ